MGEAVSTARLAHSELLGWLAARELTGDDLSGWTSATSALQAQAPARRAAGRAPHGPGRRDLTAFPIRAPRRAILPVLWRDSKRRTQYHVAVDGNGVPVACAATAANVNETLVFGWLFLAAFAVMPDLNSAIPQVLEEKAGNEIQPCLWC